MSKKIKWLGRSLLIGPYLTLCQTDKAFKKACKHIKVEKPEFVPKGKGACAHFFYSNKDDTENGTTVIVCMAHDKKYSASQAVCVLAHEATHIWQYVREWMKEDSPSHEFEAYCVQRITQELVQAYRPKIVIQNARRK